MKNEYINLKLHNQQLYKAKKNRFFKFILRPNERPLTHSKEKKSLILFLLCVCARVRSERWCRYIPMCLMFVYFLCESLSVKCCIYMYVFIVVDVGNKLCVEDHK